MQKNTSICDCCGNEIEGEDTDLNLSACLMQDVSAADGEKDMEEREIDLEDLCVSCANALYEAIKSILLRRQEL